MSRLPNLAICQRWFVSVTQHHLHGLPDLQPGSHGHPECSECGRTIWNDPKLAAAAIAPVDDGIVMVQRAIEPAIGKWSFPSGYVNHGEKVERAVEREVLEECGLETAVDWLVGLYSEEGNSVVLAVYAVSITGGDLQSRDDETLDVRVVDVDDLPELAFEHDRRIISDWMSMRRTGL